jgi:hypothetical protein
MHLQTNEMSRSIGNDVPLAPLDLLAGIIAAGPTTFCRFHRLTVDHARARARLASLALARSATWRRRSAKSHAPESLRLAPGKDEALLVATACSSSPAGRARWTLELPASELVRLTEHVSVSRETVRRRLAENDLTPWRKDIWCIPQVDAEYVAGIEDVLDLYAELPDPKRPVVCFDESPIQLIGEVRKPIPAKPGQRYDCEYRRNGTANRFVFVDVTALAQGEGHRTARRGRLCRLYARSLGRPLSGG